MTQFTQHPVETVIETCTIIDAAKRMIKHSVGALVITDETGRVPIGIITDRDLVVLVSEGMDPNSATVGCLGRAPLTSVPVTAGLREVTELMHKQGIRRIPIVDKLGELAGLVSLDDILLLLGREMADAAGAISEELIQERSIAAIRAHRLT